MNDDRTAKLFSQMKNLAGIVQAAVYVQIAEHFGEQVTGPGAQPLRAAAAANYLAGQPYQAPAGSTVDVRAVQDAALAWLREKAAARYAVVQALRVRNTLAYAQHGQAPNIGVALLEQLGAEFPDAPEPDTFEAVVQGMLAEMTPLQLAQLRQLIAHWPKTSAPGAAH